MERDVCEALGSLCSATRALPLHPASLELELAVVPTLAGCSAPTSQIFLSVRAGSSSLFLLSHLSLGWRDRLRGGD